MRGIDPEPLRAALGARAEAARQDAARFKRAERWRDRLIGEGEPALVEFTALVPAAERDEIARLAMAARGERAKGKAGAASRQLFRRVRDMLDG
jgi:ribosome-associated protein